MKIAAITLAAATALLVGGVAQASDKISDVDYLKANRCKGLAASIDGVVDETALASFVKESRGARPNYIVERGDAEFQRARKEARSEDRKARLTAELTGPCQAFLGGESSMAKQGSASDVVNQ